MKRAIKEAVRIEAVGMGGEIQVINQSRRASGSWWITWAVGGSWVLAAHAVVGSNGEWGSSLMRVKRLA